MAARRASETLVRALRVSPSRTRRCASAATSSTPAGDADDSEGARPGMARDGTSGASAPDQPDASGASGAPGASLYPGHVPLSPAQSALLTVAAGVGALVFPHRADLVGAVGETTGAFALRRMRDRMRADPIGADILARRPRITDATLEHAWSCPPGTFGAEWASFMGTRRFQPNERPPVRFVPDEELAYVATRAREVHDLWHVLFDCPTTVQGELALKALEFAQTGMPMPALSALFAPARLPPEQRKRLRRTLYPWAYRAGARAADLMCLDYEREFETGLDELRHKWRITPAPRE